MSHDYSILILFSCCHLPLDLILHHPHIQLAVKVNETTFLLVPCCVCRLAIGLCLRSVSTQLSFLFPYVPRFFTRHFFAHVFVYMPPSPPHHHVQCHFSVSQLFVPFSVSSLSLLGPCVEGGQCFLSTPCG